MSQRAAVGETRLCISGCRRPLYKFVLVDVLFLCFLYLFAVFWIYCQRRLAWKIGRPYFEYLAKKQSRLQPIFEKLRRSKACSFSDLFDGIFV